MDELKALMGSLDKDRDLIDKLLGFLDRQTDHKLSPQLLLGFLGLFNLLSIMNLVQGGAGVSMKEIGSPTGSADTASTQSLTDSLSGLLKNQGGGQNDLMGMLGSLASGKKINPGLLLSLMSMLNNQSGAASRQEPTPTEKAPEGAAVDDGGEKKPVDSKQGVELKYDRKKSTGERG